MPSEERLHPLSILFGLAGQVKEFAIPLLVLFVTAGSRGASWEAATAFFIIPYSLIAIGRYFTYRYRYDPNELVIRSGLIFRNERHIPYARIQNIDAVQNPLHRALGVVDVRIDTGSGNDVDAKLSVVTWAAYEDMRRRVFTERALARDSQAAGAAEAVRPPPQEEILLKLGARDLVLQGLIENRGMVVIAAAFGLLWETGLMDNTVERFVGDDTAGRGLIRQTFSAIVGAGGIPFEKTESDEKLFTWPDLVYTEMLCMIGLTIVMMIAVPGRVTAFPRIPGHELAGEVAALGPGVSGVAVGDRVLASLDITCGVCHYCRAGRPDHCDNLKRLGLEQDGAFAEVVRLPAANLYPVPDEIRFSAAATIPDAVGCPYHAVMHHAKVGPAQTVAVYGLGGLGLPGM